MALAVSLSACSSVESLVTGDKIDYRSSASAKPTPLDVPPDLTQLAVDPRYAPQAGTITASSLQSPGGTVSAPSTGPTVAPQILGNLRMERQGDLRWLSTSLTPEQLWPQLEAFWKDRGLTLTVDEPEVGVMETDWAENRAKLPNDLIRNTLGRLIDSLYSTGERDKFRTRVERTATGSEIYISHRGMEEVFAGNQKETTAWQNRPNDPVLESEFLSRLMVKLGAKQEAAKTAVAATQAAPAAPAHARIVAGRPAATLQVDDSFDRAWRRVGLALDRSGFTVEDRDRAQGLYFVRYVDPAQAGKEEPGFFSRLFSSDGKLTGPVRYRVNVKADGNTSTVSVLNAKGEPENGDAGTRIVKLLVDDLK